MDVDDDFDTKSATFVGWLQNAGAILSDKIELIDLRKQHAGRAIDINLVAKDNIDLDEELFSIPRDLLLNVQNSDLSTTHPDLLSSLEDDPWLSLNLTMLYENGKVDTKWRPYFNVLPTEFDTLMYWDEAELKELEASAVVNKIGKESADKMFRDKIWPIIQRNAQTFGFNTGVQEHEVLSACHRMGSLIMAYAFDIESEREKEIDEEGYVSDEEDEDMPKAMVPMADMLNADADRNNARLFYEPDALVMKAIKPIAQGEEIFNDYGPLPRSDLLRRYGYVTDNYAKYDVVEISASLIRDVATEVLKFTDEDLEAKASHMELIGDLLEDNYDISRASDEHGHPLDIFSTALKLHHTVLIILTDQLPPTSKASKLEKLVVSNEFPKSWHTVLLKCLQKRLDQYASSLDDDKQHLEVYKQRLQSGMWLTNQQEMRRKVMAMQVRVGEKEILQHAIQVVSELERQSKCSAVNGNGTKRKTSSRPGSGASTPKRARK